MHIRIFLYDVFVGQGSFQCNTIWYTPDIIILVPLPLNQRGGCPLGDYGICIRT